jgi:predicted nucleotidyltransferase
MERLCQRFRLAELYVFGSRASEIAARVRGKAFASDEGLRGSDVDVGVRPLPENRMSVDSLVNLADELERCLNVPRVDVVLLPTANPFLALDVIRGELLYCADSDAQAEYEIYVLRRAGDLAPFQRRRQELALSRYKRL